MGKSFQFNNRREIEKTEDVINTLVSATAPLTSTYDDDANTLTLAVDTGKDINDVLINGEIIKYTEGTGGIARSVEIITPADSGNPAKTCLTLKPNGLTMDLPFICSEIQANGITSRSGQDLVLQRNEKSQTKMLFENALTTITDNCRFKQNCCIGDPVFHNSTTLSDEFIPVVPLMLGTTTQTLTGNVLDGGSGSSNPSYRRGFYPTTPTTALFADTGATSGAHSLYAEGIIITKTSCIAANGSNFTSDDRFKTQEKPIEKGTDIIMKLKPCSYMKHTDYEVSVDNEDPVDLDESGNKIKQRKEAGLIAQQVLVEVPELEYIVGEHWDIEKEKFILNIDYIQLIPFLIKSNQELTARIIELENKNNVD